MKGANPFKYQMKPLVPVLVGPPPVKTKKFVRITPDVPDIKVFETQRPKGQRTESQFLTELSLMSAKWHAELEAMSAARSRTSKESAHRDKSKKLQWLLNKSKRRWQEEKYDRERIESFMENRLALLFGSQDMSGSVSPDEKRLSQMRKPLSILGPSKDMRGSTLPFSRKHPKSKSDVSVRFLFKTKDAESSISTRGRRLHKSLSDQHSSVSSKKNITEHRSESDIKRGKESESDHSIKNGKSHETLFPWADSFVPLSKEEKKRKLKTVFSLPKKPPYPSQVCIADSRLVTSEDLLELEYRESGSLEWPDEGFIRSTESENFSAVRLAHPEMPYRSSPSENRIIFKDGQVFDKQLQSTWPLRSFVRTPEITRKLRWVEMPSRKEMIMATQQTKKEVVNLGWGDGQELLEKLYRIEAELQHDSEEEEKEDKAGWRGIPKFPESAEELESYGLDAIQIAEVWRFSLNVSSKELNPEKIIIEEVFFHLTDFKSSDATRKVGLTTLIHVLARFRKPHRETSMDDMVWIKLGSELMKNITQLQEVLHRALFDGIEIVRLGAAMIILGLEPEVEEDSKEAVGVLKTAVGGNNRLNRKFAAIALAVSGVLEWPVLNVVLEAWEKAYRPKELNPLLFGLRVLSGKAPLVSGSVGQHLNSCNYEMRIRTCLTLQFLKGEITLDVKDRLKCAMTEDYFQSVRFAAAKALGHIGCADMVHHHVVNLMHSEKGPEVREGLQLLCTLNVVSPNVTEALLPCLTHLASVVKLAALEAVVHLKIANNTFLTTVANLVVDHNPAVREAAFFTLGSLGRKIPEVATLILLGGVMDESEQVRMAAVSAIDKLEMSGDSVVEILSYILERASTEENENYISAVLDKVRGKRPTQLRVAEDILEDKIEEAGSLRNILTKISQMLITKQLRQVDKNDLKQAISLEEEERTRNCIHQIPAVREIFKKISPAICKTADIPYRDETEKVKEKSKERKYKNQKVNYKNYINPFRTIYSNRLPCTLPSSTKDLISERLKMKERLKYLVSIGQPAFSAPDAVQSLRKKKLAINTSERKGNFKKQCDFYSSSKNTEKLKFRSSKESRKPSTEIKKNRIDLVVKM